MIDFGSIERWLSGRALLVIFGLLLCPLTWAQSDNQPIPLGDLARSLRMKDQPGPSPTIIDNDNLSQIMDEVENQRLTRSSLLFSFDAAGKTFQVSSPDVTCSLSFNANATSLLSRSNVPINLPEEELVKLDGPAVINDNELQISIFITSEKHSDLTTLHRLKATAAPSEVTVLKAPVSMALAPDDEWHWAIIQAKGEPPEKLPPQLPPFP